MNSYFGVYVEITSKCNLRCKHCYNDSGKNYHITPDMVFNICNQLVDDGANQLALSGGEPLLHPDIFEILDYSSKKCNLNVTLITNGTLISEDIAKKLTEYSNLTIQISIDGYGNTHDKNRGEGSFVKTADGLKLLCEYGLNKQAAVHYVINAQNHHDMIKAVNFCAEMQLSSISFVFVNQSGRAGENRDLLMDYQLQSEIKESFLKYLDEQDKLQGTIEVKPPEITNGCPLLKASDLQLNFRIDVKGNVFPCQLFSENKYIIGSIKKNKLNDIANGQKMEDFHQFLVLLPKYNSQCNGCIWDAICKKGCPALRIMNNSLDHVDFNCYELRQIYKAGIEAMNERRFVL